MKFTYSELIQLEITVRERIKQIESWAEYRPKDSETILELQLLRKIKKKADQETKKHEI